MSTFASPPWWAPAGAYPARIVWLPPEMPRPAAPAPDWPAAGSAYHRMALTSRHTWWRPVMATGVALVIFGVVDLALALIATGVAGLAGIGSADPAEVFADPIPDTAYLLVSIAVMIPALFAAAAWVQRRRPGSLSSVVGRLRWRWLSVCAGVAVATILVVELTSGVVQSALVGGDTSATETATLPRFLLSVLVILPIVPFQSAAEEYLCRGWIAQLFGAYLRSPWPGIGVGAVVFALLHGLAGLPGFVDLIFFGVVAGYLTWRTGGLEAAIALHAGNNLIAFTAAAAFGALGDNTTAANGGWGLLITDLVLLPLYAWLVLSLAHRRRLDTVAPARPPSSASVPVRLAVPPGTERVTARTGIPSPAP